MATTILNERQIKVLNRLLDTAVERAEAVNPAINAIVYKQYDVARQAIRDGLPNGPLKGVPYLFKDLGAYAVAYVDLDEGFRIMTNIVGIQDPTQDIQCGMRVKVRWEDQGEGEVSLPMFEPA